MFSSSRKELDYGPNGGLVYAMEYLSENMSWLEECLAIVAFNERMIGEPLLHSQEEQISDALDDDYYIFDCPGCHA